MSSPGPPTGGTCPKHLTREASGKHPNSMPEPLSLTPLGAEEQRHYSELLLDPRAELHTFSKEKPSFPTEEAHFSRLFV